eukprot:scaffold15.g4304.t1
MFDAEAHHGAAEALSRNNELLRRENALLRHFLQRASPAAATAADGVHASPCNSGRGRGEALLPAEKYEMCALGIEAVKKEIDQVRLDGEMELAGLVASVADCKVQEAQMKKSVDELLKLVLGADAWPPAAKQPDKASGGGAGDSGPGGAPGATERPPASPPWTSIVPAPALPALPSQKQLAQAVIPAARVEAFLEAHLARHDACSVRLQMRAGMLRGQLAKLQAQQAQREGSSLTAVDFEQLQIEHRQAEAAMHESDAEAAALKAGASRVAQELAALRQSLAAADGDTQRMLGELAAKEREAAVMEAAEEAVEDECARLEAKCTALRATRAPQGEGAKQPPSVQAYIQARRERNLCLNRASWASRSSASCAHQPAAPVLVACILHPLVRAVAP